MVAPNPMSCALLHKEGVCDCDPKAIANMVFVPFPEEGLAPVEMVRVRTQHRSEDDETMWSEAA